MIAEGTEAFALDGVPRRYEWGSKTAIQQMLGLPQDGSRIAELWFGAHPHDPSAVPHLDSSLDALIASEPERMLGPATLQQFGPRLPFLMKVLAADKALSIQVHPTRAQAEDGYAREDAAGIPHDARNRNYRDPNHKPELLCALTPFDALCGFRSPAETLLLLEELDVPELGFVTDLLRGDDPLRSAFTGVLSLPDPAAVVDAVAQRVARATEGPLRAARLAAEDAPGDVGVLLTLLLNYVRLEPGEAIYLGAGNVHAYLRGTGVEIMANSDNVLRCGLTGKHIDVPELLRITDFSPLVEPRWPSLGGRFEVRVPDFALTRIEVDESTGLHDDGPAIVLCTSGHAEVGAVSIGSGRAAFVPAGIPVTVSGSGEVFVATVGH
jgi:mannose-6-phosphate isomerase